MSSVARYVLGAELGDLAITWYDTDGTLIDFSSGWTFQVKVGVTGQAALVTKTTGITGAATAPNVTVAWAATGDLNDITTAGTYTVQVRATRTADSKVRTQQGNITLLAAVT